MSDIPKRVVAQRARQAKIKQNEQLVAKYQEEINELTNDLESLKDLSALRADITDIRTLIKNMLPEPQKEPLPEPTLIRTKSNRKFSGFYLE
jgi:polyhydroxyalkanoate synthesis regulator phasin